MKTTPSALEWQPYRAPDFPWARAFRKAAAASLAALPPGASPVDGGPTLLLYRTALELHLKALILGSGASLLAAPPDKFSVYKSRSVSWLTQIVSQMLNAAGWEADLAGFKAMAADWNEIGLVDAGLRLPADNRNGMGRLRGLAERTDALMDLLDRFGLDQSSAAALISIT